MLFNGVTEWCFVNIVPSVYVIIAVVMSVIVNGVAMLSVFVT